MNDLQNAFYNGKLKVDTLCIEYLKFEHCCKQLHATFNNLTVSQVVNTLVTACDDRVEELQGRDNTQANNLALCIERWCYGY